MDQHYGTRLNIHLSLGKKLTLYCTVLNNTPTGMVSALSCSWQRKKQKMLLHGQPGYQLIQKYSAFLCSDIVTVS